MALDQAEPGLAHALADPVEEGELPDRRVYAALMDELLGENGITIETINDQYLKLLKPGMNVHTIHAELEGNALKNTFFDLLARLAERSVRFVTLAEAAAELRGDAPYCELQMGYIEGRAMPVALQAATCINHSR